MGSFIVWVLRQLLREEYEEVESFWMVLGGVEVNSGCRDSQNWVCGSRASCLGLIKVWYSRKN
jgi:hypothetical protein